MQSANFGISIHSGGAIFVSFVIVSYSVSTGYSGIVSYSGIASYSGSDSLKNGMYFELMIY